MIDVGGYRAAAPIVLVADPNAMRRRQLCRRSDGLRIVEAASLGEVYPLAEDLMPRVMALSADFLREPEIDAVVRLAELTRSRLFLYTTGDRPPVASPVLRRVPCVPLRATDRLEDLIARASDPAAQLSPPRGGAQLPDLILIGASTGGISAIETVLSAFPADCPPTLIVQHIRDGFAGSFVERLEKSCRPRVVAAQDGERPGRGTVYIATDTECHLTIAGRASPRLALVRAQPRHGHRPSVDALFESAVPWASGVSAALLTGMGVDGAAGLGLLRRAGAHTIAQDSATSVVWGMPRAAIEAGAAQRVLPIGRIGAALLSGHADTDCPSRGGFDA